MLLILEGEVNLREETRAGEQARAALSADDYGQHARELSKSQDGLKVRVDKVIDRIRQLPDAESEFAYEIDLLGKVAGVMSEATGILARPETGSEAIAAETEAIELLLRSRRINPRGGVAAVPTRAAAAAARPSIRPWRSWDRESTRKRSARTAASRR